MLYFSKLKILLVLIFTIIFSYFSISNFTKFDDNFFSRNINLGLDLQGGSYLLLEIDNSPVIIQKLQNKLSSLKKFFKDKNIRSTNWKIVDNKKISFEIDNTSLEEVLSLLKDKESVINPYYQRFKTHEFDVEETKVSSSNNIDITIFKI